MKRRTLFCIPWLATALVTLLPAQEWTRFRGPNGRGISDAKTIPARWTEADYNWKVSLPGPGNSNAVVWGDRLFIVSSLEDGSARVVSCLAVGSGKPLWEHSFASKSYKTHSHNTMASSTPAVDGDAVYVVITHPRDVFLAAMDHSGRVLWQTSIGEFEGSHGFGASPILFEDTVILCNELRAREDGSQNDSAVVALERKTGEVRWKTPRGASKASYGTPCVHQVGGGRPQLLLTSMTHGIASLDARSGKPLWEMPVFAKRTVSSPVVAGDLVIGTCGSGGGGNYLVAVRMKENADAIRAEEAYRLRSKAPYVPTPIFKDGRLFLWTDKGGIVSCVRASDGKMIWSGRADGTYFGSPVWVDGRLFCVSSEGDVVVVSAGDRFEKLARNSLGEESHSTPVVAGGRMYVRTLTRLFSVGSGPAP